MFVDVSDRLVGFGRCAGQIWLPGLLSELTHLVKALLLLLFVLHVADPRGEVPEADVGVLRLRGNNQELTQTYKRFFWVKMTNFLPPRSAFIRPFF